MQNISATQFTWTGGTGGVFTDRLQVPSGEADHVVGSILLVDAVVLAVVTGGVHLRVEVVFLVAHDLCGAA